MMLKTAISHGCTRIITDKSIMKSSATYPDNIQNMEDDALVIRAYQCLSVAKLSFPE